LFGASGVPPTRRRGYTLKARSAKAKGTRLEKFVAHAFNAFGWKARRQPGSGIYDGFAHDVEAVSPSGSHFIVECKSWKHGWRTGDRAIGLADFLVIKRDFGPPMVYMSLATFGEVVQDEEPEPFHSKALEEALAEAIRLEKKNNA